MTARPRTAMSGLGRDCLTHPDHGPMLVLDKGTEWCPDSDHSAAKIPTPSLARAQQAVLDAARPEPDGA